MKRFLAILLLFGILLSNQYAWSSWITKKSDTSEKVESIEKEYADGFISKSECNKQKSKVLKIDGIFGHQNFVFDEHQKRLSNLPNNWRTPKNLPKTMKIINKNSAFVCE